MLRSNTLLYWRSFGDTLIREVHCEQCSLKRIDDGGDAAVNVNEL